jgi:peptide/nickel transport system ATP-binding protein
MTETLLRVCNLSIGINTPEGEHLAVDDISLHVKRGEILGIVGESGCGKSLTALSIAGLLPEGVAVTGGSILFDGMELNGLKKDELRAIQGKDISMVFQEPMTSLNPLMKIGKQVAEVLKIHYKLTWKEMRDEVLSVLGKVGLPRPAEIFNSYPHQLSGGMRQRVIIAMAILCKPKLIIADEPTTALDVTIQAQILELLRRINQELGTSILFISHDLGVISRLCNRVAVMYAGNIIEEGNVRSIFVHPVHEYTKGLIGSIPDRSKRGGRLANIPGKVPSINEKRFGCAFAPRCGKAQDDCFFKKPRRIDLSEWHSVSCYLAEQESEMEYVRI